MTEVLNRIDQLRQVKDAQSPRGQSRSRLVVVISSGLVVFAAAGSPPKGHFVHTAGASGTSAGVVGFGNLVVLVNPAFERCSTHR